MNTACWKTKNRGKVTPLSTPRVQARAWRRTWRGAARGKQRIVELIPYSPFACRSGVARLSALRPTHRINNVFA
jgi:hypothetical protein